MERPIRPIEPYKFEYNATTKRHYIYRFEESLREDDYDDEDEDDSACDHEAPPSKDISEVTLEWLMSQVPAGMKPSDIKIEFGCKVSDMAYESQYLGFYYVEQIPARQAEYKEAMKKYKAALKQYEEDLRAYEQAKRALEIKEMEDKLAQLKAQQNREK